MKTPLILMLMVLMNGIAGTVYAENKGEEIALIQEKPMEQKSLWADALKARVAPVAAFQNGGASFSTGFSWNPEYQIHPHWSLGLNVGWIIFEDQNRENDFHSFEFQPVVSYRLSEAPIGFELGAGLQAWTDSRGGVHPLVSETVFYEFKEKPLFILDRILVGYSSFFLPQMYTHEIKMGVGVSF